MASGVLRPIFVGLGGGKSSFSSCFEKRLKKHIGTCRFECVWVGVAGILNRVVTMLMFLQLSNRYVVVVEMKPR